MFMVLIVEDHEHLAMGLELILQGDPDFRVAGVARDLPSARVLIRSERLDLVILDINLPSGSGLDLIPEIKQSRADTRIIVFSEEDPILLGPMVRTAGAHGYLRKGSSLPTILQAARAVAGGAESFLLMASGDGPSTPDTKPVAGPLW
jgi:DNA-binding NarL/FixJ family response regulator